MTRELAQWLETRSPKVGALQPGPHVRPLPACLPSELLWNQAPRTELTPRLPLCGGRGVIQEAGPPAPHHHPVGISHNADFNPLFIRFLRDRRVFEI